MLFNSHIFLFAFLPVSLLGFYVLNYYEKYNWSKIWLFVASLFFYAYWNINNLPLLLLSIAVNYGISLDFYSQKPFFPKRSLFHLGLVFNVFLLCFFKYADFSIWNINELFGTRFELLKLILPLGISFFTLQQIAFLVDAFEGLAEEKNFIDYALFVSFFPQLIAGPIVHYQELMPQFRSGENKRFLPDNFSLGIFIFSVGLAKKVLLADTFAGHANTGFAASSTLDFFGAWKTSLCYTLQLYFDFSGYSEMAIGLGKMFNINIPQNFNSPLRSTSIIDFWSRWHMTLSQFINSYIFTPIIKLMPEVNFRNTMIATFLSMSLAGIWHGAGWTFVIYGMLHGLALIINHIWKKKRKKKKKLPTFLAWFLTFNFVNISFVIFRAKDFEQVSHILKGMFGFSGVVVPKIFGIRDVSSLSEYGFSLGHLLKPEDYFVIALITGSLMLIKMAKNTHEMSLSFKPTPGRALACSFLFTLSVYGLSGITEFIYFNF